MGIFKKKKNEAPRQNIYPVMKERALQVSGQELQLAPSPELPNTFGILMEENIGGGGYLLIAFAEGSVSLYFSNGGGVIGAGGHETVLNAAKRWLSAAQKTYDLGKETTFEPAARQIKFTWRGFAGNRSAVVSEAELKNPSHSLHKLFLAAHSVIAEIRKFEQYGLR